MTWSILLHPATFQQWHKWKCKPEGQVGDANPDFQTCCHPCMGVQEDSLVINFKSNSNFEQCDLIFPPSYSSSLAMISMEMHPKGQVDDAMGVQEDSLIINFKLNLQFEQCDLVLPPSPRSSPAINFRNFFKKYIKVNFMLPWASERTLL